MRDGINVALSVLMVSSIKQIIYDVTQALEMCSKINEITDIGNGTRASRSGILAHNLYTTSTGRKQTLYSAKERVFED